ncbi:glycosyltransferase family 2 protein [Microbispora sp. RL4-1S]|uniref:Glycosyltransferase family 2 protein n=1 Tax=Microbispora oryzae TaxID=2806554 RepID=A0A940WLK1_9ACTN|nr:glycosyltransferase [Microbispora oryzae]MBP2705183.1 glycosyltransferase family 2 protein [Microbispora oryzae]
MTPTPLIKHNDYSSLRPPALGAWRPTRTVTVVVPAYNCQPALDRTLAALAAQTYPAHLMEVVVADDGSEPAMRIPEHAPASTRIVRVPDGRWGRGWARQTGASVAGGEIVHWVDADMILDRAHVEAHMRWHHLADYLVVLGSIRFVADDAEPPSPARLSSGDVDLGPGLPHKYTADTLAKTRDLLDAGGDAYLLHTGATTSVPAHLLRAAGGLDTSLNMGEDTDLGFRLAQAGAVFVPDREAVSWHIGKSTVMLREKEVHRHNWSLLGDRIPVLRWLRGHQRRQWAVPYVQVVVDATGATYEQVRASVDAALAGTVADVAVVLAGPWSALTEGRRSSLDDPMLDYRLMRNLYGNEPRVTFAGSVPASAAPAPFRVICPPGWVLGADALKKLIGLAERDGLGLVSVALDETPAGVAALRLERTAAFARAALTGAHGDPEKHGDPGKHGDPEKAVDAMFGTMWVAGSDYQVVPMDQAQETGGDAAKWRAAAAKWQAEAEKLRAEVERLRAAAESAPAEHSPGLSRVRTLVPGRRRG